MSQVATLSSISPRDYKPVIIPHEILSNNPDEQTQSDIVGRLLNLPLELVYEISRQCPVGDRASLALSCKRMSYVLGASSSAASLLLPRPTLPCQPSWKNEKKDFLGGLMEMLNVGVRTSLVEQLDAVHDEYLQLARWHVSPDGVSARQFLERELRRRSELDTNEDCAKSLCHVCLDPCIDSRPNWMSDDLWWRKYGDTVVRSRFVPVPYRVDCLYETAVLGEPGRAGVELCPDCVCLVILLGVDWDGPYV